MARPAKKKIEIERAALLLFAQKGLAGTVIKDIAKEAGVTEGALYRHYKSKNDLAKALFIRESKAFSEGISPVIFNMNNTAKTRLSQGIQFLFNYYAQHPVAFSYILLTQHDFPEEVLLEDQYNSYSLVEKFISQIVPDNTDNQLASSMLLGLVLQPIIMHRYNRLTRELNTIVEEVTDAAYKVLNFKKRNIGQTKTLFKKANK